MTCLKYGQCHYWFNLNRPLVFVPCCGLPWMLKWSTWLRNGEGEDKPSLLWWEKKKSYAKWARYMCQTQVIVFLSIIKWLPPPPPPIILYALQLVLPNSSQFIINIIVTAIIKWATLKMSCTGPTSLWPYLFFFHQPPVWSSEEKHV